MLYLAFLKAPSRDSSGLVIFRETTLADTSASCSSRARLASLRLGNGCFSTLARIARGSVRAREPSGWQPGKGGKKTKSTGLAGSRVVSREQRQGRGSVCGFYLHRYIAMFRVSIRRCKLTSLRVYQGKEKDSKELRPWKVLPQLNP